MKAFWKSKTFWLNAIGLIIVVLQYLGTINVVRPEVLAGALGLANFILRWFTSQKIGFTDAE
jgi:hypothetical protein